MGTGEAVERWNGEAVLLPFDRCDSAVDSDELRMVRTAAWLGVNRSIITNSLLVELASNASIETVVDARDAVLARPMARRRLLWGLDEYGNWCGGGNKGGDEARAREKCPTGDVYKAYRANKYTYSSDSSRQAGASIDTSNPAAEGWVCNDGGVDEACFNHDFAVGADTGMPASYQPCNVNYRFRHMLRYAQMTQIISADVTDYAYAFSLGALGAFKTFGCYNYEWGEIWYQHYYWAHACYNWWSWSYDWCETWEWRSYWTQAWQYYYWSFGNLDCPTTNGETTCYTPYGSSPS